MGYLLLAQLQTAEVVAPTAEYVVRFVIVVGILSLFGWYANRHMVNKQFVNQSLVEATISPRPHTLQQIICKLDILQYIKYNLSSNFAMSQQSKIDKEIYYERSDCVFSSQRGSRHYLRKILCDIAINHSKSHGRKRRCTAF